MVRLLLRARLLVLGHDLLCMAWSLDLRLSRLEPAGNNSAHHYHHILRLASHPWDLLHSHTSATSGIEIVSSVGSSLSLMPMSCVKTLLRIERCRLSGRAGRYFTPAFQCYGCYASPAGFRFPAAVGVAKTGSGVRTMARWRLMVARPHRWEVKAGGAVCRTCAVTALTAMPRSRFSVGRQLHDRDIRCALG